jgi:hypothetical protein
MKRKAFLDEKEQPQIAEVSVDADVQETNVEKLEEVPSKKIKDDGEVEVAAVEEDKKALPTFTDEEYLIASPVVLGFAFAEKLWLEFTVSGVKDIVWNEGAYDSLVLEDNTKAIVKVSHFPHSGNTTANITRLSLNRTNTTQQKASTMSSKAKARVSSPFCTAHQEPERPSQQKASPSFSSVPYTWSARENSVLILAHSKPNSKRSSILHMHGVPFFSSTRQTCS